MQAHKMRTNNKQKVHPMTLKWSTTQKEEKMSCWIDLIHLKTLLKKENLI